MRRAIYSVWPLYDYKFPTVDRSFTPHDGEDTYSGFKAFWASI